MAGKIHAVLQRPYLKGRDVYNLIWYLSDRTWPGPNLVMLNNALDQSGWEGVEINETNWKSILLDFFNERKITHARKDVQPFLARSEGLALMTFQNLRSLLV